MLTGEAASTAAAAAKFPEEFKDMLMDQGYKPLQVLNTNESGSY